MWEALAAKVASMGYQGTLSASAFSAAALREASSKMRRRRTPATAWACGNDDTGDQ